MPNITKEIFKLHFHSPLHLSRGKSDYDESFRTLHSDTLKSALFACAIQLYGSPAIDKRFLESFTISSAFPFWQDELFFPKPMTKLPTITGEDENRLPKKLKKIQFLGQSYFERLLQGKDQSIQKEHLFQNGQFVSEKMYQVIQQEEEAKAQQERLDEHLLDYRLKNRLEKTNITITQIHERVYIPRPDDEEEDTLPYYVDRIYFGEEAGLYFMIDYHEGAQYLPDIRQKVASSLRLMGDSGIGTDRTVGNGGFEAKPAKTELTLSEETTQQINLSLYCPQKDELKDDMLNESAYNLIKRGGWIASPKDEAHLKLRKKSIYMFTEGSAFPNSKTLKGKIVDLQPDIFQQDANIQGYEIWRDGHAMFFGLNPLT